MSMTLPTIHTNGTSKERLIEALCEASQAIDLAYSALKQTAPNGRDYYMLPASELRSAEQEHFSRLNRLDEVKKEVDALTIAIDEIPDWMERRGW